MTLFPSAAGAAPGRLIRGRLAAPAGLLALVLGSVSCANTEAAKPAVSATDSLPQALAVVGSDTVTLSQIRQRAGGQLEQVETRFQIERSRIVEATLDSLLRERLFDAEARRQGRSVQDLILAEAGDSINLGDSEIAAWYVQNQERLGGRTLDQLRPQIAEFLVEQRRKSAEQRLDDRLRQQHAARVLFQPYRLSFNTAGAPSIGADNAAVTVVEFSDFQCPFCQRFAPTLKQLEQNFRGRVRVVYKQFPITGIHPLAYKAAEASLCAHEQAKFWEMHDLLFGEPNRLSNADLKEKARRLGLDQRRFDTCLDTGQYSAQVQEDLLEGTRAGVTGTPAVFINGVLLEGGAMPYDVVAEGVRKELARVQH